MNEFFDETVRQLFAEAKIDYMKGAPSSSSAKQELDVCTTFSATHAGCEQIIKHKTKVNNTTLVDMLQKHLFSPFHAQYPGVIISSDFKKKWCMDYALLFVFLENIGHLTR